MVCYAVNSWFISRANSKVYVVTSHNTGTRVGFNLDSVGSVWTLISISINC